MRPRILAALPGLLLVFCLVALPVRAEKSFPPKVVPFTFGTQVAFGLDVPKIQQICRFGFRMIRTVVNPYFTDVNQLLALTSEMWRCQITPVFILFGLPENPPDEPVEREYFAEISRCIAEAVYRHGPQGRVIWEIWNEPHNRPYWTVGWPNTARAYGELALATARKINSLGAPHLVLAPSANVRAGREGDGLTYRRQVFAFVPALAGELDAVSVHGYGVNGQLLPESNGSAYTQAQREIGLPVVNSETGWFERPHPAALPPLHRAVYTERYLLHSLAADLPFAISYNWTDESGGSGYVDAQGRMRPQMQARVGGMIAQLANYQYVRRLPGGDAASFVLLFRHIQTGDWKVAYWHALNARVVAIQTKQGRLPLMLAQIPQYRSLGGNAF